jgi:perosamine synthetase
MIPSVIVPITHKEIVNAIKTDLLNTKNRVLEFEQKFAEYIGCENAIATSSGTAALYILLKAYELKKGDEVIMPAYTCESVARLIIDMKYNIKFVDVEKGNYNLSVDDLCNKISRNTKAILAIHMFGNPCKIKETIEMANDYNAVVIEDAAQAMGAEYHNKKVGTIGNSGFFSLGVGKPITTMGGGLIVTNDAEIANRSIEIISNFREVGKPGITFFVNLMAYFSFKSPHFYSLAYKKMLSRRVAKRERFKVCFDLDNYKYKYTDVKASIGIIQLPKLDRFNDARIRNAKFLIEHLKDIEGIHFPNISKYSKPMFLRLPIWIGDTTVSQRNDLIYKLQKSGIDASVAYPNSLPQFFLSASGYPNVEEIVKKTITLPTHPLVKEKDLKKIVKVVGGYIK